MAFKPRTHKDAKPAGKPPRSERKPRHVARPKRDADGKLLQNPDKSRKDAPPRRVPSRNPAPRPEPRNDRPNARAWTDRSRTEAPRPQHPPEAARPKPSTDDLPMADFVPRTEAPSIERRNNSSSSSSQTRGGTQRRSFSIPRAPGRIFADGQHDLCDVLVEALRAPSIDHEISETFTHGFHSYPARLHPATARVLATFIAERSKPNSLIVDPFCGSGTTLVEARAAGLRAIGSDLNPLAVMIAKAKTWTVPRKRRDLMRDVGHKIAGEVLEAGKAARRSGSTSAPTRKPKGFDPNARDRRLASWFAPHVRRELELLATLIEELREDDAELADVLIATLSAILYKVSSRTSDTDGTWVDKQVGRGAAARHFATRIELLYHGLQDLAKAGGPPDVLQIDARKLETKVSSGTAAGVITSPPYAGTYDYAEHQRLRFDFLGLRHRELDDGEIGSRRSFLASAPEADRAWHGALGDALHSIAQVLAPNGLAAVVIGDSWAGGRAVYALDDVRAAITSDVAIVAWASQVRPSLGGERKAFGDRHKSEHIILLERRV